MNAIPIKKGRQAEIKRIRRANRAAAVGSLMLGEMSNWVDFLKADTIDLDALPRRFLKSGALDIKRNLSKEIKQFCQKNFDNMTEAKLESLYNDIKALRGIEIPLKAFEEKYAKFRKKVLKEVPRHSTIVISLWGLKFKFPEDFLAKDILQSLTSALETNSVLEKYKDLPHITARDKLEDITPVIRKWEHASRSCLLGCFNLVEAYLNAIAWDFAQDVEAFTLLSKRDQARLTDIGNINLREKILKYPRIVTGRVLWDDSDETVKNFLTIFKPFRDSLVHPSPFSAPEKFGGYDKLRKFYGVDIGIAMWTTKITCELITRIHQHLNGEKAKSPEWLSDVLKTLDDYEFIGEPDFT